jgi:hypothetical protein
MEVKQFQWRNWSASSVPLMSKIVWC